MVEAAMVDRIDEAAMVDDAAATAADAHDDASTVDADHARARFFATPKSPHASPSQRVRKTRIVRVEAPTVEAPAAAATKPTASPAASPPSPEPPPGFGHPLAMMLKQVSPTGEGVADGIAFPDPPTHDPRTPPTSAPRLRPQRNSWSPGDLTSAITSASPTAPPCLFDLQTEVDGYIPTPPRSAKLRPAPTEPPPSGFVRVRLSTWPRANWKDPQAISASVRSLAKHGLQADKGGKGDGDLDDPKWSRVALTV